MNIEKKTLEEVAKQFGTSSKEYKEQEKVVADLEKEVNKSGKEYDKLGATNIYYTLEWVNETTYQFYLFYSAEAVKGNIGTYIDVYKQTIIYNSTLGKWVAGDSDKGYSKVVEFNNKVSCKLRLHC